MLAGEHNITRSREWRNMMAAREMQQLVVAYSETPNTLLFRKPSYNWTSVRNIAFELIDWVCKKKEGFYCILKGTEETSALRAEIKARHVRETLSKDDSRLQSNHNLKQPMSTLGCSMRKKKKLHAKAPR